MENAIVLAKMLDRTLIVPPVWLGHAIPWISFDKLYFRVRQARKYGLEHCADFAGHRHLPWECLSGYWDYTLVSWDLLVDLESVAKQQPLVEGWDASYEWIEKKLGVNTKTETAYIKDDSSYAYRIFDITNPNAPLGKFIQRLDVDSLKADYGQYRLLHFGSLYGSTRMWLSKPDNREMHTLAKKSMVFNDRHIEAIANVLAARLGGQNGYFSVHIRLGDGIFQQNAVPNAMAIFDQLVGQKLGLSTEQIEELKMESQQLRDAKGKAGRHEKKDLVQAPGSDATANSTKPNGLRREKREGRKMIEDPHLDLPPLPIIRSRGDSPLHSSLTCRGPLYSEPRLYALNVPIFLATDSKSPTSDRALRIFFDTFPCVYTLGDFLGSAPTSINADLPMGGVQMLQRLQNKEDGVKLARFLYPMLDAMVAAKGRDILGTSGVSCEIVRAEIDLLITMFHRAPSVNLRRMSSIVFTTVGRYVQAHWIRNIG